jgi:hypothetical protein
MDIRARVEALNAERLNVVEQLRAELDATAGRERSVEEQTKIDRMDARIDEIDAEVREFVARETREREAANCVSRPSRCSVRSALSATTRLASTTSAHG